MYRSTHGERGRRTVAAGGTVATIAVSRDGVLPSSGGSAVAAGRGPKRREMAETDQPKRKKQRRGGSSCGRA
eukprot:5923117-Prymnesium_polylepis.1